MFNSSKPSPDESAYLFDLSKHAKIWISTDREVFLGIENQLRLIRMRKNNPNITLHLIYSSQCLSEQAIRNLHQFCEQHSIVPVEFEGFHALIESPDDEAIFTIANEEIRRMLNNTGGTAVSAADAARLLACLIKKCGVYSDFDVESNLSRLNCDFASLRGPMLFPANFMIDNRRGIILDSNSDFLAFSKDENNPNLLSQDALRIIRNLQNVVIRHYREPFSWDLLFPSLKMKEISIYPELEALFREFHNQYPERPNIYDFRTYLASLPDNFPKKGLYGSVKEFLFLNSVVRMSGPGVYPYFRSDLFPKGITHPPVFIPNNSRWQPYLKVYERCRIGFYNAVDEVISSSNKLSIVPKGSIAKKPICDKSWLEEGIVAQKEREAVMVKSSVTIQSFWRQALSKTDMKHNLLLTRIKDVCNDSSLVTCIEEKNYALALRRASNKLNLPVLKLLLQYRERGLIFDINEQSGNKNTALDWANNAKPKNTDIQRKVVTLLTNAGAMTAQELSAVPPATP